MARLDWMLYRLTGRMRRRMGEAGRVSYAQCGEDMIARFVFDALKVARPSYLDIGAHHPTYLNNTCAFYEAGSQGVNIEPDPDLFARFARERPRDVNLNIGVGPERGELEFFVMSARTLNTFSAEEAHAATTRGRARIERRLKLPVRPVGDVLVEQFAQAAPDFLSLDVEGLDLQILQAWDFRRWRPKLVCVETVVYSGGRGGGQRDDIGAHLQDCGYFAYAHTHVNTLFVDKAVW
jgi:FkbM family methyltransferase